MRTLLLAGEYWRTRDDFYDVFLTAVGAPAWDGRNFDALRDSIGTGDINQIEIPYEIHITGLAHMSAEARQIVNDFRDLINNLKAEGEAVAIQLSE
jgi:RNAse (barnase) inhibitor barstar